ncbi:conserved unknown protein [Ectocarpus siliculosus]|uniref:Dynein regulatory complex protein 1 n=1 Tax=Ectocarpus siliculosus TaxID=2880 RepID=D8LIH6_ECTSI|nr:conserved unknown protein [Ectocarpus siliculosus]|eukprot:CBN80015.1 conserved unknown protein [Ectocarpus siliculosus]
MAPLRAKNRDNLEFATNLPDKEERKRVRRLRVERQIAAQDKDGLDTSKNDDETAACSLSQQQVADSLGHLDKKKGRGIDAVTAVRVSADDRETQRRMAEEHARQERLQRLQEEAVRSGKQNAAVEMRWAELLDENMPQELHKSIEEQKAACAEIVASKAEDVEELLERMRTEFRELQEEYEVELEAVEEVFLQEREGLLAANKAEVDGLFEKRREMELSYMESKQKRQEQYQAEIEALLTRDGEEHTKLKIKLETDIQTLEQQLEEMRATYQLNTEKLEYNYRVLTERDMENSATLSHQKRKLTKLKDALSGLVQRYQETDTRDKKRNEELTEEFRRITKQYNDMQAKFRHFEISDNNRYEQVWSMHREEVLEAINKVLQADEIIHQQQLGWEWKPPNMDLLAELDINSVAAAKAGGGVGAVGGVGGGGGGGGSQSASAVVAQAGGAGDGEGEDEDDPNRPGQVVTKVSGTRVKAVLRLLSQEAGFLVDPGVKDALDAMTTDEAQLVSAVSMLKALGVEEQSDIEELMRYFFGSDVAEPDAEDIPSMATFRALGLDPDREPDALKVLLTIIQPDNVVSAIHNFVKDRKEARLLDQTRTKSLSLDDGGGGGGDAAGKVRRQREKVIRQRERDYWNTIGGVIGEEAWQVWKQLSHGLERYNAVLAERSRRITNVKSLQQENTRLKEMLRSYLGSAVNDDLIIPPTRTIQIGAPH